MDEDQRTATEILLVSVDDREKQQMMLDRVRNDYEVELDMTLLSDPDHAVIDRYGIYNDNEARSRPVPHPTTIIIDREGIMRWRYTEIDYRTRPTNEEIVQALMEVG